MTYQVMILENSKFNLVKEFKTIEEAKEFKDKCQGKVAVFKKVDDFTSIEI